MSPKNFPKLAFLILAFSLTVTCQDPEPEAAEAAQDAEAPAQPAVQPVPPAEPEGDFLPAFGICKKHTDCREPMACFDEVVNKKKFKICVTREFHGLPADMKKKMKFPAHLG